MELQSDEGKQRKEGFDCRKSRGGRKGVTGQGSRAGEYGRTQLCSDLSG